MDGEPRPPVAAEALVHLLLPKDLVDPVAGDLAEEYAERREHTGRLPADLWYWSRLLVLRPFRLRRELRRLEGRWRSGGRRVAHTKGANVMGPMSSTVRYALRRLAGAPGFAAVAVVSLALGIGGNTAVFTLVNAVFLEDPGIRQPDRVLRVYQVGQHPYWRISWEQYRMVRDELDEVFSDVTTYRLGGSRVGESDDLVMTMRVTGDYFGVVGVAPALGRAFLPGEETDVEQGAAVAILSHDFWTRRFGGDPDVVGSTIRVDARPTTVVGVLPESFKGRASGIRMDLFVPDRSAVANAGSGNVIGGARLRPGVSLAQARAAMGGIAAALNETRPDNLRPVAFTLVPESEVSLQPRLDEAITPIVALLFAMVGLVLLIACTNLASFLLARASDRRKEFAVRLALGAGRGRIVGQLLTESFLLALLGGAAGTGLAYVGLQSLVGLQPPGLGVSVSLDVSPDWRVLLFTFFVATVAGVAFGLLPALRAGRQEVAPVLREEGKSSTEARGKVGLRSGLVVVQVALSLVLLTAAGLFLRSLLRASAVDPGFQPEGVALVTIDPATTGYEPGAWQPLYEQLESEVRRQPEVRAAALGTRIPLQLGDRRRGLRRPEVEPLPGEEWRYFQVVYVTPDYFDVLGMELHRGRAFVEADTEEADPVAILSEAAVATLWEPGADVLGRSLRIQGQERDARLVGVARDTKVKTLGGETEPVLYLPMAQEPQGQAFLVARGSTAAPELARTLRQTAKSVDPDLFVHSHMSAEEATATALYLPRMGALLLTLFGGLALLLVTIGLYGVVRYTVARRRQEVGIRLSVGATGHDVVLLMMRGGMGMVLAGLAAGLALAVLAGQLLERFLFGVPGADPVTFVTVAAFLSAVALLASWLPARQASRVVPMETLKAD